jgi:hypothetical protein
VYDKASSTGKMQGRGVTNFTVDKPSHAYTTATTEFDDALVSRGIVTTEQVMLAKGASPEEALRLMREKEKKGDFLSSDKIRETTDLQQSQESNDSDADSFDDEDDEFFARYREERLAHLSNTDSATVEHISRGDWSCRVNDVSRDKWVLVTLLDFSLGNRRQEVLQELNHLARQYASQVSLVTIEATEAIPNWPSERVPAMFAYRDGIKQQEWITTQSGTFPTRGQLEQLLQKWNILDCNKTY